MKIQAFVSTPLHCSNSSTFAPRNPFISTKNARTCSNQVPSRRARICQSPTRASISTPEALSEQDGEQDGEQDDKQLRVVQDDFDFELELEEVDISDIDFPEGVPIINSVQLTGRLGADPDYRTVGDNIDLCKFSLAVKHEYDPSSTMTEDTSWFDIEVWGSLGRSTARRVRKGMLVAVSGSIGVNAWVGKDGIERQNPVVTANLVEVLQSKSQQSLPPENSQFSYKSMSSDQNTSNLPF